MPFIYFFKHGFGRVNLYRIALSIVVLNLSVNGYVLESVFGYNFEHNKQLAFGCLFIIALYTVLTSTNKDETAVYD